MIELAILGLLVEQDLHGYELKKRLTELLGPWSSVSFGSLYPALARLERRPGAVKPVEADRLRRRDPHDRARSAASWPRSGPAPGPARGGTGRRGKKVYGITAAGRRRLARAARRPTSDDDRTFAVRSPSAATCDPAERLDLFAPPPRRARRARWPGRPAPARAAADPYRRSLARVPGRPASAASSPGSTS